MSTDWPDFPSMKRVMDYSTGKTHCEPLTPRDVRRRNLLYRWKAELAAKLPNRLKLSDIPRILDKEFPEESSVRKPCICADPENCMVVPKNTICRRRFPDKWSRAQ